jgi:hypothetical protein
MMLVAAGLLAAASAGGGSALTQVCWVQPQERLHAPAICCAWFLCNNL